MREGWEVLSWSGAGPWGGSGWGPRFLCRGFRGPEILDVESQVGLGAPELGSLAPQQRGWWGFFCLAESWERKGLGLTPWEGPVNTEPCVRR